jgi:hypothetical protein
MYIVESVTEDKPGAIKSRNSVEFTPSNVCVYNEGEVHSLSRSGAAKLIRIEGNPDQTGPGKQWQIA